ncbi:hypothetical protein Tco_0529784 [Tanacetum coccineum]
MTSPIPLPTFSMPSPSQTFSFPSTSEPVFFVSTSEPTWAMKMEYWIMNSDHNLWNIVINGKSRKKTGRDPKGNIMILPPVSVEEHIAVQRETKARTILLTKALLSVDSMLNCQPVKVEEEEKGVALNIHAPPTTSLPLMIHSDKSPKLIDHCFASLFQVSSPQAQDQ